MTAKYQQVWNCIHKYQSIAELPSYEQLILVKCPTKNAPPRLQNHCFLMIVQHFGTPSGEVTPIVFTRSSAPPLLQNHCFSYDLHHFGSLLGCGLPLLGCTWGIWASFCISHEFQLFNKLDIVTKMIVFQWFSMDLYDCITRNIKKTASESANRPISVKKINWAYMVWAYLVKNEFAWFKIWAYLEELSLLG